MIVQKGGASENQKKNLNGFHFRQGKYFIISRQNLKILAIVEGEEE